MEKKIAVCVVPNDQVLNERMQSGRKERADGIPHELTKKHRATFHLPHKEENKLFDEIIFTEGTAEDAEKVLQGYEKDFKAEILNEEINLKK